ncbi:MAG TPA: thermonuclease family protein [Actinomycetota bacterium]|jgi:micrococcal nuclease|nr:thermonuclease family protein [Actinomycetota bacterium]
MIATKHSRRPARPGRTRRRPPSGVAVVGLLVLAVMVAVMLAGCRPAQAPRLATSPAERATWPAVPRDSVPARVERVVDGDTFIAGIAGRHERIRLIGVDTPETVDPDRPVQPYGKEASSFAKHMLSGRTVRLVGDVEPRDRYGRLLAYVWLPDGTFWNALLAAEGYAQLITIPPDVTYAGLFQRLVDEARSADRGLWASRTP